MQARLDCMHVHMHMHGRIKLHISRCIHVPQNKMGVAIYTSRVVSQPCYHMDDVTVQYTPTACLL